MHSKQPAAEQSIIQYVFILIHISKMDSIVPTLALLLSPSLLLLPVIMYTVVLTTGCMLYLHW